VLKSYFRFVGMSDQVVADYMKSLAIRVSGFDVPRPIKNFQDCGFPMPLMNAIAKQSYENQLQFSARPCLLALQKLVQEKLLPLYSQ
jgi:ATP-dependent RNA helicase DDX42